MNVPLHRIAGLLTAVISLCGALLMLILAGALALPHSDRLPELVNNYAWVAGGWGVGIAWELFAALSVALAAGMAVAALRPELRGVRRAVVMGLGTVAWLSAVTAGIRPPGTRTGVFTGTLVYGTPLHPDLFVPCEALPRGAELGFGRRQDALPVMAAVRVPERGWHGSHPGEWQSAASDSHSGLYFHLRVRGTFTGPGNYGSPPAMHYRLRIDSVLSVRPRSRQRVDCPAP